MCVTSIRMSVPVVELTPELEASLMDQILSKFPSRTSVTLGGIGCILRRTTWVLVVHGMVFAESGSGRDFTADFDNIGNKWIISNWCYDN